MKIFSNFDTKLKEKTYLDYQKQYGVDSVLLFGRSKLYWFIRVFAPSVALLLFVGFSLYFFSIVYNGTYFLYVAIAFAFASFLLFIPICHKYINYKMDFIIVTPDFLLMYNQSGIFTKKIITVNEDSLKSVSVERSGLIDSIFNNGNIVFLSEGDETRGEIVLHWVAKPERKRDTIIRIMAKDGGFAGGRS